MPELQGPHGAIAYTTAGDGFPLLLLPDPASSMADWAQQMPLLGELCRVIAYETRQPVPETPVGSTQDDSLIAQLVFVLETLAIERAYLAGYAVGGHTALQFARHYPERLEGLILVGIDPDIADGPPLEMAVPTCLAVGAEAPAQISRATRLASRLPRCAKVVIPGASTMPHREQPLPLGHAMMNFLIRCERQRNLVRGASFLL